MARRHTELIAIILDSSCFESSVSADSFITHLKQVRARNAMPNLFGLLKHRYKIMMAAKKL